MILLVADVNEAHAVGGDAPWVIEFSVGGALTAESPEKSSCWFGKRLE